MKQMFFWNSVAFSMIKRMLISYSSAFPKSSLDIWKFSVHVLLKSGLEDFEHYFASVWDECNYAVVWIFFGIAFLWDWNENWPFPVLWPLLSFPKLLACWVQHSQPVFQGLTCLSWNSIPSTRFVRALCFLRPTWLCIPGYLALGEWLHLCGYLGHEDLCCIVLLCILATSS